MWIFDFGFLGWSSMGDQNRILKCRGRNLRRITLELCILRGARRRRGGRGSTVQLYTAPLAGFGNGE